MKHPNYLLKSFLFFVLALFNLEVYGQHKESPLLKVKISVATEIKGSFQKDGRILLHLNRQREKEPRNGAEITLGITPQNWDGSQPFVFESNNKDLLSSGMDKLSGKNQEKFFYQVVYKQNIDDGNENVAGNLYSKVDSLILAKEVGLNHRLFMYSLIHRDLMAIPIRLTPKITVLAGKL
jgi:hypothetical protein